MSVPMRPQDDPSLQAAGQIPKTEIAGDPHDHTELDPNKPSNVHHGDRYVVRLYCDNSHDPHVYVRVKHLWFKSNGQVLCILHYFPDGSYRYVMFRFSDVIWYQMTPERFEKQIQENETQVDR